MTDAAIERLIRGMVALSVYETQLQYALDAMGRGVSASGGEVAVSAMDDARDALHAAAEKGVELQQRLPGRVLLSDLSLPMTWVRELLQLRDEQSLGVAKEKLTAMRAKVHEQLRDFGALRLSLDDELRAARADALKPRPITAYDVARAAEQQQADSEAAARDLLRKLPAWQA
jgi:hypothetical protein